MIMIMLMSLEASHRMKRPGGEEWYPRREEDERRLCHICCLFKRVAEDAFVSQYCSVKILYYTLKYVL